MMAVISDINLVNFVMTVTVSGTKF